MSDFKVKLQKVIYAFNDKQLINSSYLENTISFDKPDKQPKEEVSQLRRNLSVWNIIPSNILIKSC